MAILKDFGGTLQTDGYAVYPNVAGKAHAHAGCMAHARRKFVNAPKETILEPRVGALPKGNLGKACDYALAQWERLVAYASLEDRNNPPEQILESLLPGVWKAATSN